MPETQNRIRSIANLRRVAGAASAAWLVCLSASPSYASPILAPTSASASPSSEGAPFNPPFALIDQSGLSAGYISGVTDFATFTATTTASYGFSVGYVELSSVVGVAGSYWQFDFASPANIDKVAVWNQSGSASLNSFNIQTSLLPDFSVSQTFGPFTMSIFGGGGSFLSDVFAFAPTTAKYVRLNVLSNAGYSDATRLNEVAFEGSLVPEPASLALLGLGIPALLTLNRRKRA